MISAGYILAVVLNWCAAWRYI